MIWLTWRQFRVQAWVIAALVAAVVATLLVAAPGMFGLYRDTGLAACTGACESASVAFAKQVDNGGLFGAYLVGSAVLLLLPALIGVFWGAPLVARELESGTHRLVWNQTVSRGRWLTVKLAGIGAVAILASGLLSLVVTWFSVPIDRAGDFGRVTPLLFSSRGVVPMGYALLAFVGGLAIGMLTRRLVVAMALTLVFVVVTQLAAPFGFREHLVTPTSSSSAFEAGRIQSLWIDPENRITIQLESPAHSSWVLSNVTVGPDGKEYHGPVDGTKCGRAGGPDECHAWLAQQGLVSKIDYIPAEGFWALQWRELGVLLVTTGLLSAFCLWWIRRRVS
ncbi:ABC transporter permease subunit [Paractinoplanes maris]|uniref:ABC transporter permease subunit n=1 Tax=Paractinoplanes maris TaxID=1734446 RepID=UPI00202062F7|nr:ABC transporter permease subunit [Actinoplanes maris]